MIQVLPLRVGLILFIIFVGYYFNFSSLEFEWTQVSGICEEFSEKEQEKEVTSDEDPVYSGRQRKQQYEKVPTSMVNRLGYQYTTKQHYAVQHHHRSRNAVYSEDQFDVQATRQPIVAG